MPAYRPAARPRGRSDQPGSGRFRHPQSILLQSGQPAAAPGRSEGEPALALFQNPLGALRHDSRLRHSIRGTSGQAPCGGRRPAVCSFRTHRPEMPDFPEEVMCYVWSTRGFGRFDTRACETDHSNFVTREKDESNNSYPCCDCGDRRKNLRRAAPGEVGSGPFGPFRRYQHKGRRSVHRPIR